MGHDCSVTDPRRDAAYCEVLRKGSTSTAWFTDCMPRWQREGTVSETTTRPANEPQAHGAETREVGQSGTGANAIEKPTGIPQLGQAAGSAGLANSYATPESPAERSLAGFFRERSQRFAQAPRWRQQVGESVRSVTYAEQQRLVNQVISGLDVLGARPGDAIGILSGTRWEWIVADWAIMGVGATLVTIYPTLLADTVVFMLRDASVRYLFIEDQSQYDKLRDVLSDLPQVERVVIFDGDVRASASALADPRVLSFDALLALSPRAADEQDDFAAQRARQIGLDDRAAVVYTSGTTGQPKGVIYTHRSQLAELSGVGALLTTVRPGMVNTLFLPLSHSLGRLEHQFSFGFGGETVILPSLEHLAEDIAAARPNLILGAPRLYEKAYAAVVERAAHGSRFERALFGWAERTGRRAVQLRQSGQRQLPLSLRAQLAIADLLVFRRIRAALGGRLEFAVSGGAPLEKSINEFFHAAGIPILEGWGLTETSACFTVNPFGRARIGTVGVAFPHHAIRIAADGEVLVRGPCVFSAYLNNPEATAEAFDEEGWFYTGDLGTLDADGYLTIVDRKKDLIATSGGKKIAPQMVEGLLKVDPLVAEACVYGDREPYIVALLTLDWQAVATWASQRAIAFTGRDQMITVPELRAYLDEHVARVNAQLARFEQVKRYGILTEDFTQENGLLTPTLKIKRKVVVERYRAAFEALYQQASPPSTPADVTPAPL
jgi:long-chain acyl-CoA synthetase